jgi:hypothetical protein
MDVMCVVDSYSEYDLSCSKLIVEYSLTQYSPRSHSRGQLIVVIERTIQNNYFG